MIVDLIHQFEPEPDDLLRAISKHITDDMLGEIALADYGEDHEDHLAELCQIRDTGEITKPMGWCPGEVLELFRWSQPENFAWKPGRTGLDGHWMRAFCCAALLRATCEPGNHEDVGADHTAVNLIQSLRAIPTDLNRQASRFFAWLVLESDRECDHEHVCAYAILLLWISLQLTNPPPDEALISLANWLCDRSKQLYPELIFDGNPLPLRMGVGNPPPQAAWVNLGNAIFDLDLSRRSPTLQQIVRQIGIELTG
jgi:hypothetical protein